MILMRNSFHWPFLLLVLVINYKNCFSGSLEEEKYGVKFATECEVCKLVTKELEEKLSSLSSSDVIETGYNMDSSKKKKKYNKSELRLVEALEETCEGMMDYRIHKERKDSTRWAKHMSQTFKTLHGLVDRGVKVDLGIPHDLWDEPSAEVSELKTQCEQFLETHDEAISDWYFGDQTQTVQSVVCPSVMKDSKCLAEPYGEDVVSSDSSEVKENTDSEKPRVGKRRSKQKEDL